MSNRFIKNPFPLILIVMVCAIGLVSMLAWVALKPINQKNGFNRKFIGSDLTFLATTKNDAGVLGIAGYTNDHIYFRTKDPSKIWVTGTDLQNGAFITLNVPNNARIASAFYMEVDSPAVHIMAGNGPAVIKADLNGAATFARRFPTAIFTRAVAISPQSYAFRGFDTTMKTAGMIFLKGNPFTGEMVRETSVSEKKGDIAGITTDGYLNFDKKNQLLTFVSYYQNRFICLDTNLNLVYTSHTIDTISTFQVEAGQVGKTVTNTSPARTVNSRMRVSNGNLYIISKITADNEDEKKSEKSATIDYYSVKDGAYQGSFYVPYYKREKVSDFKVLNDRIIVLYKSNVVIYSLH